ncbi:MAG: hypothetical protein V1922_05140 [bacterium]
MTAMDILHTNPTGLFPSYERWTTFLKSQDPARVTLPTVLPHTANFVSSFMTPACVLNRLEYSREGADIRPSFCHQQYAGNGYRVESILHQHYLGCDIVIPQDGNFLTNVFVSSKAAREGDTWVAENLIFLSLKQKYLAKLKDQSVVPSAAERKIWITRGQSGEIIATIENGVGRMVLSDDALERICVDTGFDFTLQEKKTTGTIGNISFTLPNVATASVDEYSVWQSLTGIKPSAPHIFPIEVSVRDQN